MELRFCTVYALPFRGFVDHVLRVAEMGQQSSESTGTRTSLATSH